MHCYFSFPQYVEKLDKIIRFAIKVKTLTLEDLDTIWNAQVCGCLIPTHGT